MSRPPVMDALRTQATRAGQALRRLAQRPARWRSVHGLVWLLGACALALLLYVLALVPFTPAISDIRKARSDRPAQLLSQDGRVLAEYQWVNRDWVPLAQIAPSVVDALIATEDHRFYSHWGLDWRRTFSAVVHTAGGDRQGGSTITQQLARNLFPEDIGRAPTLTRKLKEAITAFKIEWLYSKQDILETYLNTVPFLYNAYGIEMAARTYFDTSADKLSVLQSATLIGMLKGTAYYNPVLNPERAQARRNTVLAQMKKRGKLSAADYDKLSQRPLRIRFERQSDVPGLAPHLAQQLRRQLIDWCDRHGYSLYFDGLVIRTSIDGALQEMAIAAVQRQGRVLQGVADAAWTPGRAWGPKNPLVQQLVRESDRYAKAVAAGGAPDAVLQTLLQDAAFLRDLRTAKTRVQAGFMALDPTTGAVRAWVGSRDFVQDPFDHVQAARRQPGSTFKLFVYGAAFAKGMLPSDELFDTAVEIPLGGQQVWRPRDGSTLPSEQPMALRDALAFSKNTVTAQLMMQVGPQQVAQLARAMGVRESPLEAVPALALGTSPVSLKEMVTAYGSIANGGRYMAPQVITRIEDRHGNVLQEFKSAAPERALDLTAAQQLRDAMRGVVDQGTGVAIRSRFGIQADVAGKTGTTQDSTDGWFILMHPQLVAGAWVGFNDARITLRSSYWGQGAHSALPMVGEVFRQALRSRRISAAERFIDEEESTWLGRTATAAGALRHWVYDLFGRPVEGIARPAEETLEPPPVAPRPSTGTQPRPEILDAPEPPPMQPLPRFSPPAPGLSPDWGGAQDQAPPQVERGVVVPSAPEGAPYWGGSH